MELFYGWLANHFTKCVTERFLFFLLIVTARTLMWRCQILQRPADKSLLHPNSYVPHHPPLDVVFFGALKTTWERHACEKYKIANPGIPGIPLTNLHFWQGFQGCLGGYVKCPHLWVLRSFQAVQNMSSQQTYHQRNEACTITAIFKQCQAFTSES